MPVIVIHGVQVPEIDFYLISRCLVDAVDQVVVFFISSQQINENTVAVPSVRSR